MMACCPEVGRKRKGRRASSVGTSARSGAARPSSAHCSLKLKGKEPQAWLTDVIERLLPWRWKAEQLADAVEA
jgi:hypothetical protein